MHVKSRTFDSSSYHWNVSRNENVRACSFFWGAFLDVSFFYFFFIIANNEAVMNILASSPCESLSPEMKQLYQIRWNYPLKKLLSVYRCESSSGEFLPPLCFPLSTPQWLVLWDFYLFLFGQYKIDHTEVLMSLSGWQTRSASFHTAIRPLWFFLPDYVIHICPSLSRFVIDFQTIWTGTVVSQHILLSHVGGFL